MKSLWTNTLAWVAAVIAALALAIATPHESSVMGKLPSLQTKRLDQRPLVFPQELGAERTLALIAFSKAQRPDVESWIDGLKLRSDNSISWVRVPVYADNGDIASRDAAEHRMLSRYPTPGERSNVVPVFTDRDAFIRAAGLSDTDHVYAVVVNRQGEVLARAQGEYDPDKARALRETLHAQNF